MESLYHTLACLLCQVMVIKGETVPQKVEVLKQRLRTNTKVSFQTVAVIKLEQLQAGCTYLAETLNETRIIYLISSWQDWICTLNFMA